MKLTWKSRGVTRVLFLGKICLGWISNKIDGWHAYYSTEAYGSFDELLPCTSESEARTYLENFVKEQAL